jgi:hypothetical protein
VDDEFDITRAEQDDVPLLAGLLAELFATEPEFTADRALQEAGLRLLLSEPGDSVVFVARRAGRAAELESPC